VYWPASESDGAPQRNASTKPALPRGNGECILVVEDEENIRDITRRILERFGYGVLVANNGAEGLAQFTQHHDEIAAVVTDISMPVMDGPTMVVALRKIDSGVRILGCSGLSAKGQDTKTAGAGIEHFIPKPYSAEILLQNLAMLLSTKSGSQGQASPIVAPPHASAQTDRTAGNAINVRILADLVGDEPAVIKEFLEAFKNSLAASGPALRVAMEQGDCDATATLAHKLKSAARSIGAASLGDCLEAIETHANQGAKELLVQAVPLMAQYTESVDLDITEYEG